MSVNIHGKQYITVSERVQQLHADKHNDPISINTEFLPIEGMVVCRATVKTDKGVFTGTSAANPSKMIEKMSPYEVAETSAIGRALGFAGYGIVDGIATADEVVKATEPDTDPEWVKEPTQGRKCTIHNTPLLKGFSKTKVTKEGNPKPYWWHPVANGEMCFGND